MGRNHEIIINLDHESYCYECMYYIGLYAEYDNVLGMINFKNPLSRSIIPEGNSVTKVLKRNQSDVYDIYGLQSRILFENFSGQYEIYFQEVSLSGLHDVSIQR